MTLVEAMNGEREDARSAGLIYVSDLDAGIRRKRAGVGFSYVSGGGKLVSDRAVLRRIKRLAVPPAWTDVWICANENGHIQATGRDARGRKQYIYHAEWRELRDRNKFERLIQFARQLPRIRRRIDAHMAKRGMPREKVLATVVSLLDKTLIRVGTENTLKRMAASGSPPCGPATSRSGAQSCGFISRARAARSGA